MSQQSDQARASVTSLTPEPELKEEKKETFDEDISLEEALSTLYTGRRAPQSRTLLSFGF